MPKRKGVISGIPSLRWWKQFGAWESFLISSWHVWSRSHVLPLAQLQLLVEKMRKSIVKHETKRQTEGRWRIAE